MTVENSQHDATAEFNEALAGAFAGGDFDGLGAFFTEGAILMPPRGRLLDGRAAISAFWRGVNNRFTGVTFTSADVKAFGEAVKRETGTYAMEPNEADGAALEGKYLFVWQLVDGEWQIESAIWNRNGGNAGQQRANPGGGGMRQGRGQRGGPVGGYRSVGQGGGRQGGGGQPGYRRGDRPSFQGGGPQGSGRRGGGNPYEQPSGLYSDLKE